MNKKSSSMWIALAVALVLLCGAVWLHRINRIAELKRHKNMNGLVAWWPGDGYATDLVGGQKGVLENGADYGPGLGGKAFNFGSGRGSVAGQLLVRMGLRLLGLGMARARGSPFPPHQFVRVADRPELRMTNELTIEAWINPGVQYRNMTVVGKWGTNKLDDAYMLEVEMTGNIRILVNPSGEHVAPGELRSASTLPASAWTHVAATYDGGTLKIYINGQLDGSQPYAKGISPSTHDLGIGGMIDDTSLMQAQTPFVGRICDVSIYNRALSAEEILAEKQGMALRGVDVNK